MASLPTLLRSRDDAARFDVVDSAYWMKGCSSLGLLRFAVLLQSQEDAADLCLIDIKQAVATAAPRYSRQKCRVTTRSGSWKERGICLLIWASVWPPAS
jgi:uncharacterized protein (DUF2252 family)